MVTRYMTRNSVYEVDQENLRARRLNGDNPATEYTGDDGQWQSIIAVGYREELEEAGLLIVWAKEGKTPGSFATTYTSEVMAVEEAA